jgi:hypothetical protein
MRGAGRGWEGAIPDYRSTLWDIVVPSGVLLCNALRRLVHGCHEMLDSLDGLVAQPHLAAADEMHHGGDDFLIGLGHVAHGLDHIEKG